LGAYIDLTPDNTKATKEANGGVAQVIVKVISLSISPKNQANLEQSKLQNELRSLLDRRGKGINAGDLDDASKLLSELDSLKNDTFATKLNDKVTYSEAADLTEIQWENILFNNRMLNGYYYQLASTEVKPVLNKAPKRAFSIRRPTKSINPTDAKPDTSDASKVSKDPEDVKVPKDVKIPKDAKSYLNLLPGIPPFYVNDDAEVNIVETQNAFQKKMVQQGFDYRAIEANVAGLPFAKSLSLSGSWSEETSYDRKFGCANTTSTLNVSYDFPRIVVDLSPEHLELSDECVRDILDLTKENRNEFYRKYGNAFPTRVVLGGSLHSAKTVTFSNQSELDAHKEEMKDAAGFSFASPKFSIGINHAHVSSKETIESTAKANRAAHLTWEARGGDTVLCSNPPLWAYTVKDYRYWRVISQSNIADLATMIAMIDPTMIRRLHYPGVPVRDPLTADIIAVVDGKEANNMRLQRLKVIFKSQKSFAEFNAWVQQPAYGNMTIQDGTQWSDLKREQKILYGRWLWEAHSIDITSPHTE
jgi:hypothetical protein